MYSKTQKTNVCYLRGKGVGIGKNRGIGKNIQTTMYKDISNKSPTV